MLQNGLLEDHILDLHQANCIGSLVFIQLHGNVADILLHLRDLNILQRIYPAARLFNLLRQQLRSLFDLRQTQHILEYPGKCRHRIIQLTAGLREAVGVDAAALLFGKMVAGHIHRHDILKAHI